MSAFFWNLLVFSLGAVAGAVAIVITFIVCFFNALPHRSGEA